MRNLATAVLGLLAFLALLFVQGNVPWATEGSGDGTVHTWGETQSGSNFLFSYSSARGWYEGGWADADQNAVTQFQVAAALVVLATAVLLIGCLLAFGGDGPQGSIVTLVGGLLASAGTLMFYLATLDLYDNDASWQVGFYFAFAASLLGVAGGVLGLAAGNLRRTSA
jgi:hypothetical protein